MSADRPRYRLLADIYSGAIRGDFDDNLGVAGRFTQIVLAYVPVIGTLCAIRDYLADRRSGDRLGVWLNIIAVIPVFGGFPKTAEVLEHALHIAEVHHRVTHLSQRAERVERAESKGTSRSSTALALALLTPLLLALLSLAVVAVAGPRLRLAGVQVLGILLGLGFALSLLVVGIGRWERRRNRRRDQSNVHRTGVLGGLTLGYLYLVLMVFISGIAVLAYQVGAFR